RASRTEPDRLSRWIGYWEGDPSTGAVQFSMTAEGDDPDPEEYRITRCEPPHRFAGVTSTGDDAWHLSFDLDEEDGVTTLTFRQVLGTRRRRAQHRPRVGVLPRPARRRPGGPRRRDRPLGAL